MRQIVVYLFVMNNEYSTGKTAFNIIGRMVLNVYIMYIEIVGKRAMFPL